MAARKRAKCAKIIERYPVWPVELVARMSGGVPVVSQLPQAGNPKPDEVDVKEGSCKICFTLNNEQAPDVRFDASQPIFYRHSAGNCPTKFSKNGQLVVESCTTTTLTLIDFNTKKNQKLQYQLNFIDLIGGPIDPIDPIILNGGGGTKPLI